VTEAREGVAIFGPDGECRYASEGFAFWAGPLLLGPGESLEQALARSGVRTLAGVPGAFEGPKGAFLATVDPVEDLVVVRVRPWEAQGANALHGRFLSVASHDLRGALANVRSYASLVASPRFGLGEKALKAVQVIARNSDRALALAEDIFDALKADSGTLRVEPSPEPLRPLFDAALERCRAAAEEKGAALSLELSPELSGEPSELTGASSVDPDRFARACANLLAHAVWRTPEGGGAGLSIRKDAGRLEVSAWDEGAPATAEELALAFERDARVAHERTLSGGFRLCLAGALARAQGGEVGARVDPHGRQNFFFTLPVHPTEQPGVPA
jgi:signal transduction histidine kinase